ncbi:MAG: ABC1 kinase family protein [Planctomycetaceae bacterium]
MKITAIPQLYRNLRRWREILDVLRRYGLADWLSQFPQLPFRNWLKDAEGLPLASHSREVRMRLALTELGPTFIKLGQILASRPDLVGHAMTSELKRLHSELPAIDSATIRRTLQNELGPLFEREIIEFDDTPLATASIGQVHRGQLADGTDVVIKVQRPGIEEVMLCDLDVLSGLAQLAERVGTLAAFSPETMVRQLTPVIRRELDFGREKQNLELFSELLADCEDVSIPVPIERLCTRRVLVMTRIPGEDLSRCRAVEKFDPEVRQRMAKTITETYMQMLFKFGLFHADPHPGNLIAASDGTIGILDFGMVGRIDTMLREQIEEMLVAIGMADSARLTQLIRRAGEAPPTLDDAALSIDVSEFISTYGRQNLGRFDLTGALNDLGDMLHRHGIKLPSQSAMLMKMLISLEGTLSVLHADFDAMEVMASFVRGAAKKRLSPRRRLHQIRRMMLETEYLMQIVPDQFVGLLEQARRGEIQIQLDHRSIGSTANRLVVGLIASALFLGSSLLLAMKVPPVMFADATYFGIQQISMLGSIGTIISVMMMLRLYLAINASGHLSRDNED